MATTSVPRAEWPFIEVLSDDQTRDLETINVYATVVEPKQTKTVLGFVNKHLPALQKLEHCKRVRRTTLTDSKIELSLLLCEERALTLDELEKCINDHGFSGVIHPKVVPVPRHAPLNRQQFEAWKQVWPLTYREDTRQDPKFTSDDIKVIQQHMKEILQSDDMMRARIVDPAKQRIIAEAQDTRHVSSHPLHHAVMNCVDAVAKAERIAATDTSSMGRPKRKASQVVEEESNSVYLCTGYDIYLTHEPCAMCAMALVHSRIGRVFYCRTTKTGCLGTLYKIHCYPSLNHHYRVFKHVLFDETMESQQQDLLDA
ncbi:cytidine deaminase-like protein [Lichtheimia hyalospora FSU 10163]|nr:cytidine deaminase-like protein [Lichtheimia hyalospora FSU 10163]